MLKGCQRQVADQARCGDPGVIHRAGPASSFGTGLQFTPADGDLVNDTWIAASCLVRGLPLATFNIKDFSDFADHDGLRIVGVNER